MDFEFSQGNSEYPTILDAMEHELLLMFHND